MRQALKIKCWKCGEVITMSAEVSRKPGPLVEAALPCPFCGTANQVIVRANQVKSSVLYRDGQSGEAVELEKPGALLSQVFDGMSLPQSFRSDLPEGSQTAAAIDRGASWEEISELAEEEGLHQLASVLFEAEQEALRSSSSYYPPRPVPDPPDKERPK